MKEQSKPLEPLSRLEELVRRPFAGLSPAEKAEMGKLNSERADRSAQAFVDNLNRNVMARNR